MNRATLNYLLQRSTAALLLPLTLWLMFYVMPTIISGILLFKREVISIFFQSTTNIILLMLFIFLSLYHGFLGIISIIKDYVNCETTRKIITLIIAFTTIFSVLAGTTMIIDQHILTLMS